VGRDTDSGIRRSSSGCISDGNVVEECARVLKGVVVGVSVKQSHLVGALKALARLMQVRSCGSPAT
jgi:hypothetical protein